MSGSERRKAAAETPARETLWRVSRLGGGIVVEEVTAADVKTVHRLTHEVYDIAIAKLGAELHRRLT